MSHAAWPGCDACVCGRPHPGLAELDLRALRHAVLLGLVVTLVIAGRDAPARVMAAFEPGFPRPSPARVVQIQAWVTPPAYTGLAPVFLKQDHSAVAVPAGARLTVDVTGGDRGGNELVPETCCSTVRERDPTRWISPASRLSIRSETT